MAMEKSGTHAIMFSRTLAHANSKHEKKTKTQRTKTRVKSENEKKQSGNEIKKS